MLLKQLPSGPSQSMIGGGDREAKDSSASEARRADSMDSKNARVK